MSPRTPPEPESNRRRPSKSGDHARKLLVERAEKLSALERMKLALELGERNRKLGFGKARKSDGKPR